MRLQMKWFGRHSCVGQRGEIDEWFLCLWGGQREANPFPPLPWFHVPLFLYTRTICFSCSNEEQCLIDKGASSLLLCCLWLELDAGKNGNSQCECFFSSSTGYGWTCTLYIAHGTIVNTVRMRKEWITAPFLLLLLAKNPGISSQWFVLTSVCVWVIPWQYTLLDSDKWLLVLKLMYKIYHDALSTPVLSCFPLSKLIQGTGGASLTYSMQIKTYCMIFFSLTI